MGVANHHPFTAPMDEDLAKLESDPAGVRAKAYDLVINGYECGGGSIRIHSPEVQALAAFADPGHDPRTSQTSFRLLLDALRMGAPPHGGIALGLDRLTMMLARTANIRDVIAFPKKPEKPRDLMTGEASGGRGRKTVERIGIIEDLPWLKKPGEVDSAAQPITASRHSPNRSASTIDFIITTSSPARPDAAYCWLLRSGCSPRRRPNKSRRPL